MRKLLKVMFGQIVVISVLLVCQMLLLALLIMKLSEYAVYINIIFNLLSLAVIVIIINRHSNPMYKLAWVIPILLFPVLGGVFYLFIMGQSRTKRFFSRIKNLESITTKNYPQSQEILREIDSRYPDRSSAVKYINKVCSLNAYRCREAKYFPCGEDKFRAILEELEKAERYIFVEYFIISRGYMWDSILNILKRKVKEGVDVRVMYDGMGSLAPLPLGYHKKLENYGIKCRVFSPFTPFLSALQNNRDHRKIIVIDGKTAFTGGVNLADEYINLKEKHGHWKDMGIMIKGEAAFSFTIMFLQMWHSGGNEKFNMKDYEPVFLSEELSRENGYVMPYSDIPLDNYQTGEYIYLDIINRAKKYIYITTPYLILDNEMEVALINAAISGVDVKIICPAIPDHWYARAVAYSYYKELTESGIKIYEYTPGFMHGKTFASDGEAAVVGSINLDFRSLYLHFECAAYVVGSEVVKDVVEDFDATLKKSRLITLEDCNNIRPLNKLVNAILRVFAPLM